MGSGVKGVPCACRRCRQELGRYLPNGETPESGYLLFIDPVLREDAGPLADRGPRTGTGIYLEGHDKHDIGGGHRLYQRVRCSGCRVRFGRARDDKMSWGKVRVTVVNGVYYV
jgi:hypothetical protein